MKLVPLVLAVMASAAFAGEDMLFVGADGTAETGRFIVRDEIGNGANGALLGVPIPADPKFVAAAATARIAITEEDIVVAVDCPVPAGMTPVKDRTSAWKGDGLELFIRPDLGGQNYFYYAINLARAGESGLYHNRVLVKGYNVPFAPAAEEIPGGFRLKVTIPRKSVFKTMPKDGDEFSLQIVRVGKTGGGVQSWRPVGTSFHDPSSFGRVVFGSKEGYLARQLERKRRIAAKFAGSRLAVYRPADIWANDVVPSLDSQPLSRIRMTACRDGRAYFAFAVSNLGDIPFVGQVKAFDKGKWMPFYYERDKEGVARRISAYCSFPVYTRATTVNYDPVAPLPMGSVIRLSPGETELVWLEFDARGLEPGDRSVKLRLKSATPGFGNLEFPLDLRVRDIRLGAANADRACYMYLQRNPGHGKLMKFLAERNYNLIYAGTPGTDILPRQDGKGNFIHGDYTQFDRLIESQLANGIDRKTFGIWIYLAWNSCAHPEKVGPVFGEKWCAAMRFYLNGLYAHLEKKFGLTADRIVLYPIDEPWGDLNDPKSSIAFAVKAGKLLRSLGPKHRLMVNPLPGRPIGEWKAFMAELAKYYDIVEHYRPGLDAERIAFAKSLPFKEQWTYDILQREDSALTYRLEFWQNLRDGFREITTYWHLDDMGGGDGLDPNDSVRPGHYSDYGTLYVDFDNGDCFLSRRQLGVDIGYEDACLMLIARGRAKGDAAKVKKVEELITRGSSASSMAELDDVRGKLMDFIE